VKPLIEPHVAIGYALTKIFGATWAEGQHARDTAQRILRYWQALVPPPVASLDKAFTTFKNEPRAKQMVVCCNIPFHSACAHHLLPFEGHVHIGYTPDAVLCGLSKFPRAVNHFAQRPQIQELMGRELADYLYAKLEPHGLGIRVVAVHTCTTCRGVVAPGTLMVTDIMLGDFQRYETLKQEFLSMIRERTP